MEGSRTGCPASCPNLIVIGENRDDGFFGSERGNDSGRRDCGRLDRVDPLDDATEQEKREIILRL